MGRILGRSRGSAKSTGGQYYQVRLKQAGLIGRLLYGTKQ